MGLSVMLFFTLISSHFVSLRTKWVTCGKPIEVVLLKSALKHEKRPFIGISTKTLKNILLSDVAYVAGYIDAKVREGPFKRLGMAELNIEVLT